MRKECFYCTRKHLAQAEVLMTEAKLGYPMHMYLAIGHLAEAEAEILAEDEALAKYIRSKRKAYEEGSDIDTLELIEMVCELESSVSESDTDAQMYDGPIPPKLTGLTTLEGCIGYPECTQQTRSCPHHPWVM